MGPEEVAEEWRSQARLGIAIHGAVCWNQSCKHRMASLRRVQERLSLDGLHDGASDCQGKGEHTTQEPKAEVDDHDGEPEGPNQIGNSKATNLPRKVGLKHEQR